MDGTHRQIQFRRKRNSDAYTWDTYTHAGDTYTDSNTYTDAKTYSIAKASTHAASSANANACDTYTHAYAYAGNTYSYTNSNIYTDAKTYPVAKASAHAASSADAAGVINCDQRSVNSCSRYAEHRAAHTPIR